MTGCLVWPARRRRVGMHSAWVHVVAVGAGWHGDTASCSRGAIPTGRRDGAVSSRGGRVERGPG